MDIITQTIGKTYTGGCHCGAVTFTMDGPFYPFVICHCTDCLRIAGFTWAAAKLRDEQLHITKGASHIDWYKSSDIATRGFCKTCHAQMFFKNNDSPVSSVSVGMFDDYDGMQIAGHIFRNSLPNCCKETEALPDMDSEFDAKDAKDGEPASHSGS